VIFRFVSFVGLAILTLGTRASAADPPPLTAAPPDDAKALVEAPKAPGDAPALEKKLDATTASLSAGGLLTTGNSRLLAMTANGAFDTRFNGNGVGASLLANYGQGAPAGKSIQVSAENIQGRLRYDRFVLERASVFLIGTGRHDRFQGLDFRLNVDPGVKYLFAKAPDNTLWGEAGYDFQYDIRRDDARVEQDAMMNPVLDAAGQPVLLDKTATDHSLRLFAGFRHSFNKEVTLSTGLEYLQSVVDGERHRLNFDALFAAKIGGGLALGLGFGARYDHAPLPGKETLDTTTSVSLIYAFSDAAEAKAKTCPCPELVPVVVEPPAPPPPSPPPPPARAPLEPSSDAPSAPPIQTILPVPQQDP
jgi:putative salt-induced outer membrane protein